MLKKIKLYKSIIINTIVLLILLELILGVFYFYKSKKEYNNYIALKVNANVHEHMSEKEVKTLYQEFNNIDIRWAPFTHYKPKKFQGVYNNIDSLGYRKTSVHKVKNELIITPIIKIFCFGGSTMYGIGATDETTIPSLLGKLLAEKFPEKTFDIVNFGIIGYTRNQEYLQLLEEIKRENIPNIAVFYDGVNEVLSASQNNSAGIPMNASKRNLEFNSLKNYSKKTKLIYSSSYTKRFIKFIQKKISNPVKNNDYILLSKNITINYYQNIVLTEILSDSYNFKAFNYIQPTIFTKKNLSDFEEIMKKNNEYFKSIYDETYTNILNDSILEQHQSYKNIQNLFNPYPNTLFTDFCHTTEEGNLIVAEEIFKDVCIELKKSTNINL